MITLIAISTSLLVIAAGVFLLAKTQKEQLGKFYSIVSYGIIIHGFLILICSFCCCICSLICKTQYCNKPCKYSNCDTYSRCCKGEGQGCSKGWKKNTLEDPDCCQNNKGRNKACKHHEGCPTKKDSAESSSPEEHGPEFH